MTSENIVIHMKLPARKSTVKGNINQDLIKGCLIQIELPFCLRNFHFSIFKKHIAGDVVGKHFSNNKTSLFILNYNEKRQGAEL